MKKILLLILIGSLSVFVCSCGRNEGSTTENNVSIDENNDLMKEATAEMLTLENYCDYLNISVNCFGSFDTDPFVVPNGVKVDSEYTATMLYGGFEVISEVRGVSTNFNYNDVIIKIKVSGTYDCYTKLHLEDATEEYEFEADMILNTNIAGNGRDEEIIELPSDFVTCDRLIHANYEITEISGTVTPAY